MTQGTGKRRGRPAYRRNGSRGKNRLFSILLLLIVCIAGYVKAPDILSPESLKPVKLSESKENGSLSLVQAGKTEIPGYDGEEVVELDNGKPEFNRWDAENLKGDYYGELDFLGRCTVAYGKLHHSLMPTGERGSIGHIKPTGWKQEKYEGLVNARPPYLYNRCHLIAYALTGQNANEKNLITGTRYMNATVMLPWEEKVMRYLEDTDNHVLYRVTPYFKDDELLARGVEMEAYSVEDEGAGLCFHVFVYNVQPGVKINYATGESTRE